ncbi:MAG: ribonuclease III [Anaerolineae bacterium]|nr:ribonuclease III [Anaerolineae bacterium]
MTLEDFLTFNDFRFRNSVLLREALTHSSFLNEHPDGGPDNERLEFLGDAILAYLSAEMLFTRFPGMREGEMTRLRAALVRADTLADMARECKIGEALRMARGEEATGGRERVTLLGDAFEALLGALYLDQGIDRVRDWLLPRLSVRLDEVMRNALDKDARSLLQEIMQERTGITPTYTVVGEHGPEHEKEFTVEVRVGDQVLAQGTGRSKQTAAQDAARRALENDPD